MDKKGESKSRYEGKYHDYDGNSYDDDEKYSSETKISREDSQQEYLDDGKNNEVEFDIPQINILELMIQPQKQAPIEDPLELTIIFSLDRDVVAAYWEFKVRIGSCRES